MPDTEPKRKDWVIKGKGVVRPISDINQGELIEIAEDLAKNGGHLEIKGTGSGHHIKLTPVLDVVTGMPVPDEESKPSGSGGSQAPQGSPDQK